MGIFFYSNPEFDCRVLRFLLDKLLLIAVCSVFGRCYCMFNPFSIRSYFF